MEQSRKENRYCEKVVTEGGLYVDKVHIWKLSVQNQLRFLQSYGYIPVNKMSVSKNAVYNCKKYCKEWDT